jgi:uncharacterized protein
MNQEKRERLMALVGSVEFAYGEEVSATETVDACAFHEWPSVRALAPYLDSGWRDTIMREGDAAGPLSLKSEWLYMHPRGFAASETYPDSGVPGSDVDLLVNQAVGDHKYVVLGSREGILSSGVNHYAMARATTQAMNRWTISEWLPRDPRFRALVQICATTPRTAAADIREFGAHPGMVGVALGANGLSRPFGQACYHDIYEAAVEMDLPVVIQEGSEAVSCLDALPTSGGSPATYAEYATHAAQAAMGHVSSFVTEGAFEKFPTLKVLCVGGGAAWLPPYAWRMDYWYSINSHDMPWLKRRPSDYLADHIRIGTSSLERPRREGELDALWKSWPDFSRILMYMSEYPTREDESVSSVAQRVPTDWHQAVFSDNAKDFFSLA